jgi:transposase
MGKAEVFTPPQVAKRYRVAEEKVVAWIHAGELAALNLATNPKGRPRYKITADSLQAFERRRAIVKPGDQQ